MEQDQLLDADFSSAFGITPAIRAFLSEIARWANFLAIIGFVMIGLLVFIAIFAGSVFGMLSSQLGDAGAFGALGGGFITVFYLVIAGIYVFPVLYLYRFASYMKLALRQDNQEALTSSFENLKSHYKFIGILMLITLGLYAFAILITIIGALAI